MVNNIDLNQEYDAVGSLSNWLTGHHVNEKHVGHLDTSFISFDPS